MNAKLTAKIKTFSAEIKEESGSFFSDVLNADQLIMINDTYNWVLRQKRNLIKFGDNDPIFSFDAKNERTCDIEFYVIRPSHQLSNDDLLKIIICVNVYYLTFQQIKSIIKK